MTSNRYDYVFKILTIGESSVGKSCLLLRLCENTFDSSHVMTVGIDFKIKYCNINGVVTKLQVWDTSGQERFRTITKNYYKGGDGILLVYDITDRESFDSMRNWIKQIELYAKPNVIKVMVGNKVDLSSERKVSYEEGYQLAQEFNLNFFESSAKDNINVHESFLLLATQILELNKNNKTTQECGHSAQKKKESLKIGSEYEITNKNRSCCN